MKEKIKIIGEWEVALVSKKTGKILSYDKGHNTIVNTGKEELAKLLNGISSTYFRAIAIGEGSTSPTAGDTALETEVKRSLATLSYVSDYKARFTKTFTFGSGETYDITEAGVFDSDTESGSVMFDRFTFSAKSVDSDVDLKVTVTITIS